MPSPTPDVPDRVLAAMFARFGGRLAQRPGESLSAYARRLRRLRHAALPEPIHRSLEALMRLLSATLLAEVLPVAFGDLLLSDDRN
jgi:hypothetical protein